MFLVGTLECSDRILADKTEGEKFIPKIISYYEYRR